MKDKLMAILEHNEDEFCRMVNLIIESTGEIFKLHSLRAALAKSESKSDRVDNLIVGVNSFSSNFVRAGFHQWVEDEFEKVNKQSTVERACKLIQGRANVGQVKYGVSIDRDDLTASQWVQHALEEMLDGAQYLIRLKDEMEALQKENAELKQELKHKQKQELKG